MLQQRCGLRESDVIADVGAGAGMLAEIFLQNGNAVFAVEPNAEMRARCERVLSDHARLRIPDAVDEATGLTDAGVDMVAVGRVFHWFDRDRALLEFRRIPTPGGWVVLITNRRAPGGTEQSSEFEGTLLEHGLDYATIRQGYRNYESLRPFGDGEIVKVKLPGEQRLTLQEFLGQTQLLSVSPMEGHGKYEAMQGALRGFFTKWSRDGVLRLETVCSVLGWRTPKSPA